MLSLLLEGLHATLVITLSSIFCTILIAAFSGWMLARASGFSKLLILFYVEFFRGTSALLQLFWLFFVLPLFGVNFSPFATAIIALSLNAGAYGAVIIQAAVRAVPKEQWDAAASINLGAWDTLKNVVFPQAIVVALPGLATLCIEILKNSALVSLITISDLTFVSQIIRSENYQSTEIFSIVLILYFILSQIISFSFGALEKRGFKWRSSGV